MLDGFLLLPIVSNNDTNIPILANMIQLNPLVKNGMDCSEKFKIVEITWFSFIPSGSTLIASKIDEIIVKPIVIL